MEGFFRPEIVWCFLGILMLMAEFICPDFIVLFFGIGAFAVTLICMFVTISINAQVIIFFIVSLAVLFVLRKWVKNVFKGFIVCKNKMQKNIDSCVGETSRVVEDIKVNSPGRIEFHGTTWNAISSTDIPKGAIVVIEEQNNLTFKVKKLFDSK